MNMSNYGVKIGIKADTWIMLLKPSTVSAVVNRQLIPKCDRPGEE